MRKLLIIGVGIASFFLLTAGRCSITDACATETTLHTWYVSVVAPFRSAKAVANEQKFYNVVMALCAAGAPPSQIDAAAANSAAARSAQ